MTSETSNLPEGTQLDVTIGDCKRLLDKAYTQHNDAVMSGAASVACYWDGYICGIRHVLQMQEE